jgi:hypothetical protein
MTRRRLRPAHDPATLAVLYRTPYRSSDRGVGDHIERVHTTAGLAAGILRRYLPNRPVRIADLSAGNGETAALIGRLVGDTTTWLGDYAAHPDLNVVGPIEETILGCPTVDLFLLTETLEHLDDPDLVLRRIRGRAAWLVLSTPIGEATDDNPEHYWAWDQDDVYGMLVEAGWYPRTSGILEPDPNYYRFQLWACR